MFLDIDAGNSRIKWRALTAEGERFAGGSTSAEDALAEISLRIPTPQRVRIASVRQLSFRDGLAAAVRERWGVDPEFAQSRERGGGVHNAYADPARLGVDRWLAMLAAYGRVQGACCVLDAGSALTLDFVGQDGQHEGGYIVPGLAMQRAMLLEGTAIPMAASGQWGGMAPGQSTVAAIHHGILAMVVQWIVGEYRAREEVSASWLVTGGDADVIVPALNFQGVRCLQVPELVLEGLPVALP